MPRILFTSEVARELGRKGAAVKASRRKLALQAAVSVAVAVASSGQSDLQAHSRAARQDLSHELLVQLQILKATPPVRLSDLPNSPDGEGRASLVARITDTAAKVYGWDAEKGNSVVLIGLVSSMDPESAPVIDAEVVP